jgi:murein DD-endopeptidase MepM/ murein hydrolase activator NlpD
MRRGIFGRDVEAALLNDGINAGRYEKPRTETGSLAAKTGLKRKKAAAVGIAFFLALAIYSAMDQSSEVRVRDGTPTVAAIEATTLSPPSVAADPRTAVTSTEASRRELRLTMKRGDTVFGRLVAGGIPATRVYELVQAVNPIHDLGRLQPGQSFIIEYEENDGRILRFQMDLDDRIRIVAERRGSELEVQRLKRDTEKTGKRAAPGELRTIEKSIESGDTLFDLLTSRGIPPTCVDELAAAARPIYDLGRLHLGQSFSLVYDPRDGRTVRFELETGEDTCLVVERKGEALEGRQEDRPIATEEPSPPARPSFEPTPPFHRSIMECTLRRGDTLFDILIREGLPAKWIHELVVAAREVYDLGRLRQGGCFTLVYDERDGRVLEFEMDIDEDNLLQVERGADGLKAKKQAFDYDIRHKVAAGEIQDSLFMAADEAGLPPALTLRLAEIFAWDIDFHVDMRRGDRFRVLFEEKYLDGRFAHYGRILAAVIQNQGRDFFALRFEDGNGRVDYYDLEGKSLQKLFLKSPLKFTRISSRFSRRRYHPILKIYRPHLGVDYAAPIGTPVRTIGDGKITFAGWKGGYGRFIKVRHNGIYTSTYGHLHRFAKGIRGGKYVRQGQVIGYVGATGLATGPHLDFRLLKSGRFINPLKVNYPNADPVRKEDLPAFQQQARALVAELQSDTKTLAKIQREK